MSHKIGDRVHYRLKDGYEFSVESATILEETSRSWIVGMPNEWWARTPELIRKYGYKIPKNGTEFLSEEEAARVIWAGRNRHELSRLVGSASTEVVLKVATALGVEHP